MLRCKMRSHIIHFYLPSPWPNFECLHATKNYNYVRRRTAVFYEITTRQKRSTFRQENLYGIRNSALCGESHLNFNLFTFCLYAVGIPLQVTPLFCWILDLRYTLLWECIINTLIERDGKQEQKCTTAIKLILQYFYVCLQSCKRNNT